MSVPVPGTVDHVSPDPGVNAALREYLYGLTLHGVKLGLHNITRLLAAAQDPQLRFRSVHVGGTNGKGSVVAMVDAMLCAAGYRTGRFTSPHLIDLEERFLAGGMPIPGDALDAHIAFFRDAAAGMPYPPTFFELCTAIAFRHFAQARVEAALVEVGMGGRLDSTNVLLPLATAITNIDLEHTQYLGHTLAEIAFEKAGILKPGVPAVVGEPRAEARDVILARATEVAAPVIVVGRDLHYAVTGGPWEQRFTYRSPSLQIEAVPLPLAGRHQGSNAAIAVALAELLRPRFPRLDKPAIVAGLAAARWPCRLERVLESPPVLIDAAHNVAGARHLVASLGPCVTVLAVASDKDAAGMIEVLAPQSRAFILTAFTGKRSLPVAALSAAAGAYAHHQAPTLAQALALGLSLATQDCPLLITGSIYTAGEARRLLSERYGAPPLRF